LCYASSIPAGVLGALEFGIWSRDVRDGQLIHHSDYAEVGVKPRSRGVVVCGQGLLAGSSA
jgi:hypothetical protein